MNDVSFILNYVTIFLTHHLNFEVLY